MYDLHKCPSSHTHTNRILPYERFMKTCTDFLGYQSVLNIHNDSIPSSFQCLESNLPLQLTREFGEYPLPCLIGSSRSTNPINPLNSIIYVHACTCTCTCECMYYEWEREKYDIILQMGLLKINITIICNIIITIICNIIKQVC